MRLIDVYWMETQQTRQAKTPELRETVILSDAAEECRLRKIYMPMTAAEYDQRSDSLYTISDPQCGGTYTDRLVTLQGTRYLERSYAENNIVGAVKTIWMLKAENMEVTDMVRAVDMVLCTSGIIEFQKPSWYNSAKDKMELYVTRSQQKPANLPKEDWEENATRSIENVEEVKLTGTLEVLDAPPREVT